MAWYLVKQRDNLFYSIIVLLPMDLTAGPFLAGGYPASYVAYQGLSILGVKRPEHEAGDSSSVEM